MFIIGRLVYMCFSTCLLNVPITIINVMYISPSEFRSSLAWFGWLWNPLCLGYTLVFHWRDCHCTTCWVHHWAISLRVFSACYNCSLHYRRHFLCQLYAGLDGDRSKIHHRIRRWVWCSSGSFVFGWNVHSTGWNSTEGEKETY